MQKQEVCFFRHEALKTQKYVADHELLHFLKIKIYTTILNFGFNYDSPREFFFMSGEKKYKYFTKY